MSDVLHGVAALVALAVFLLPFVVGVWVNRPGRYLQGKKGFEPTPTGPKNMKKGRGAYI